MFIDISLSNSTFVQLMFLTFSRSIFVFLLIQVGVKVFTIGHGIGFSNMSLFARCYYEFQLRYVEFYYSLSCLPNVVAMHSLVYAFDKVHSIDNKVTLLYMDI